MIVQPQHFEHFLVQYPLQLAAEQAVRKCINIITNLLELYNRVEQNNKINKVTASKLKDSQKPWSREIVLTKHPNREFHLQSLS